MKFRERCEAFVGERIVAEIEIAELGEGRKLRFGESALAAAELLQAGPRRELVYVFVIHLDVRIEMPTEGEALHGGERSERLEDAGFVFVARARIPDFARQIKLAQMLESCELAEFDWAHDGGGKVDGYDVEIASRKMEDIADGRVGSFEDQTSFPAEHPFGDISLCCCGLGGRRKNQEGRNE